VIPIANADLWLKRLLSEKNDTDTAFPVEVRVSALQEAVIEYASLRPDLYSEIVELPYNTATGGYELPADYEWIMNVHGLKRDGKLHAYPVNNRRNMNSLSDSECWPHSASNPTHLVWENTDPRRVYIDGPHDAAAAVEATVVVAAFRIAQPVNGDPEDNDGELNARYSALPRILDYALSRCYARETAASSSQIRHLEIFQKGIDSGVRVDSALNPHVKSLMRRGG